MGERNLAYALLKSKLYVYNDSWRQTIFFLSLSAVTIVAYGIAKGKYFDIATEDGAVSCGKLEIALHYEEEIAASWWGILQTVVMWGASCQGAFYSIYSFQDYYCDVSLKDLYFTGAVQDLASSFLVKWSDIERVGKQIAQSNPEWKQRNCSQTWRDYVDSDEIVAAYYAEDTVQE